MTITEHQGTGASTINCGTGWTSFGRAQKPTGVAHLVRCRLGVESIPQRHRRVQANRNQGSKRTEIKCWHPVQSRSNYDPIKFATSPGPITICQCQGTFFSTPLPGNTARQTRLPHVLPMEVSIEVGDAAAVDVRHP